MEVGCVTLLGLLYIYIYIYVKELYEVYVKELSLISSSLELPY